MEKLEAVVPGLQTVIPGYEVAARRLREIVEDGLKRFSDELEQMKQVVASAGNGNHVKRRGRPRKEPAASPVEEAAKANGKAAVGSLAFREKMSKPAKARWAAKSNTELAAHRRKIRRTLLAKKKTATARPVVKAKAAGA